jgi:hypothetical protein
LTSLTLANSITGKCICRRLPPIEPIDFIKSQNMNYIEGNIIKYTTRYKFKNGIEDLKKAQWYLDKLIEEYQNNLT